MNNDEQFTGKTYVGSDELYADVQRCMALVAEMNTGYKTEAEVRSYLRQITGSDIDESVRVFHRSTSIMARQLRLAKAVS